MSINRILYKQKDGKIDIATKEFKDIEQLVFKKYFPEYAYEFQKLKEEHKEQNNKVHDIAEENIRLKNEIAKLKERDKSEVQEAIHTLEK